MGLNALTPRHALLVGLLALLPVGWFAFGRSTTGGLVAAVNVVLIIVALYVALGPVETRHGTTQRDN
nr:cytochrome-ba3 oxidase subunit [Natrialba taiwanensis]